MFDTDIATFGHSSMPEYACTDVTILAEQKTIMSMRRTCSR